MEQLVARLRPQPDVPSVVRKLPASTQVAGAGLTFAVPRASSAEELAVLHSSIAVAAPVVTRPPEIKPLAPERYKVQFTVCQETYAKLRQVQDLMRHVVPNGDPAEIFDRALSLLLSDLLKTKCGATHHPRRLWTLQTRSRHVPAAIRREVWRRDGGRCAFEGADGRCVERGLLEFHHVVPYADGGEASIGNIQLRCRAHNQYEANLWTGAARVPQARETRPDFGA